MNYDQALLLKINSLHSDFFDNFMWNYSQKWTWIVLYVVIICYIIYRYRINAVWILIATAVGFGLSDWGSHELKHLFMHPRPTHDPLIQNLVHVVNDYRGGNYGFPSSHACNSFALATFISLLSKDRIITITLILWATLNAYSRMYLGVHYPTDILAGLLLGIGIAVLCYLPLHYTKKDEPSIRLNEKYNNYLRYSIPLMWICIMICISF